MVIQLTPDQERRIRSMIESGAYNSIEEIVDAALSAVEEHSFPGFDGSEKELEALMADGLKSEELTETEFWNSVKARTAENLAEYERRGRRK